MGKRRRKRRRTTTRGRKKKNNNNKGKEEEEDLATGTGKENEVPNRSRPAICFSNKLKLQVSGRSLFLYCSSSFVPSPDELLGESSRCFPCRSNNTNINYDYLLEEEDDDDN